MRLGPRANRLWPCAAGLALVAAARLRKGGAGEDARQDGLVGTSPRSAWPRRSRAPGDARERASPDRAHRSTSSRRRSSRRRHRHARRARRALGRWANRDLHEGPHRTRRRRARAPAELWVRTMGGAVGRIGQIVEGEATLEADKASLVFLKAHGDAGSSVFGVAEGAQGEFPVATDVGHPAHLVASADPGAIVARPRRASLRTFRARRPRGAHRRRRRARDRDRVASRAPLRPYSSLLLQLSRRASRRRYRACARRTPCSPPSVATSAGWRRARFDRGPGPRGAANRSTTRRSRRSSPT